MRKDLAICLAEARRNGAHLPLTALVDQFYSQVQKMGGRRWDTSRQDLMKVTAGEPVREECLKGLLNGEVVFALVRGQVSPGDERIESCVVHANRKPLKFVIVVPRAPVGDRDEPLAGFTNRPPRSVVPVERVTGDRWSAYGRTKLKFP